MITLYPGLDSLLLSCQVPTTTVTMTEKLFPFRIALTSARDDEKQSLSPEHYTRYYSFQV